MRIAVDARSLAGRTTGIGRYTAETLAAMRSLGNDWDLYAPDRLPERWRGNERTRVFESAARTPFAKLAWLMRDLPRAVNRAPPDLFWGPAHRLPRGLDERIAQVVTVHDLVWKHAAATMPLANLVMEHWRMPIAIRQADAIVAVSESTARDIERQWPHAAERVHVVPGGASVLAGPAPRQTLVDMGITGSYALFVGTLEPRKNLGRVIAAFAGLPAPVRESTQLVIAGARGWGGVDIERIAKDAGVAERVVTTGYVDEPTLSALYRGARLLVMPSLYEGFGLPLVEAMSVGVPGVTSQRASMPEVAGDAALLVDPESVDQIRDAMARLLSDDALARELGERGLRRAARLSWQAAARSTLEVFDVALHRRDQRLGRD